MGAVCRAPVGSGAWSCRAISAQTSGVRVESAAKKERRIPRGTRRKAQKKLCQEETYNVLGSFLKLYRQGRRQLEGLRERRGPFAPARPSVRGGRVGVAVQMQRAGHLALAGTGGRVAQAADVMPGDLVRMRDEVAAALAAGGHREHAVVDELHQPPGACHAQQRLEALRLDLLEVELVGLDDGIDLVERRGLVQVLVRVQEQARVNVGLPGHEPVGGERQLSLARALAGDFLVEAEQPLVAEVGLALQHLQAGTEVDERHRALDLLCFGEDALVARHGVLSVLLVLGLCRVWRGRRGYAAS